MRAPALHVDGKWIRDAAGAAVTLRGVALADLDAIYKGHRNRGGTTTNVSDIIDRGCEEGWKIDVFRLTVHPDVKDETGVHGWVHYAPQEYFRRILDPAVQHAISRGRYVIVDWHYVGAEWWLPEVAARTEEFWLGKGDWPGVAALYADNPNVLFELFNEPGPGRWSDWKPTAARWVAGIRARGAGNIVLVGGPSWSQVMPQTDGDLIPGPNIAYACHIYPAHAKNGMPRWIEFVSGKAPVIMTEWGYERGGAMPVDGTTSSFGIPFRRSIDSRPNVGWVAWCFDFVYHPVMFDARWVLLGNASSSPADSSESYMGEFVKTWLAEAAGRRGAKSGS